MYLQLHWAPCAFTGPVRDTPTISLVSLCVYRDAPTTPLGSLCFHRPSQGYTHNPIGPPVRSQGSTYIPTRIAVPSQGFPHSRPHRKPLLNSYSSQFPSLPSNVFVFFTSSFSVFCLRLILSPTLMGLGPVPSLIHNVSFRLGLVISASHIMILPTRLKPLTPATQSDHFSLPGFRTVSYDPVLKRPVIPFSVLVVYCDVIPFPVLVRPVQYTVY